MELKKVLAVVMSLCMVAGTVSYGAPVITQSITAQAANVALETDCYSYNETTRVLTLKGEIDRSKFNTFSNRYKDSVKTVIAEKG